MKIVNFGSCNIDYVYSLEHIVIPGETESTYNLEVFPGGKGLNQSIAIARAGAEVFHVGCVGEESQLLLDTLEESDVNISYIKTVEGKNGHAIIQLASSGENSIFLYPGSNRKFTTEFIDYVLADFSAGDILVLQNEINQINYIVEQAYQKKLQVVLNPSPFDKAIKYIDLQKISYLILNEIEAEGLTGYDNPEESLEYFKVNYPSLKVVVTLGGQGCRYMDNNQDLYQSAFKVDVVDTTAAGDTFAGYFIAGLAEKKDILEVLNVASAAAALTVSRKGAATSIPYEQEVLQMLKVR